MKQTVLFREAVREYLRRLAIRKLERELADGYRANAELSQQTSEAFICVDADNF